MAQATREYGEWPLKRLMTEVVGSGHKSADDMDRAQAREAFQRILGGEPDPTTLGAFWLANRWKRNNPEELAAYTDVMREESVVTAEPDCDPVDCGANYDGKGRSAILGVGAGIVAAAAGTSARSTTSRSRRRPATRSRRARSSTSARSSCSRGWRATTTSAPATPRSRSGTPPAANRRRDRTREHEQQRGTDSSHSSDGTSLGKCTDLNYTVISVFA